MKQHTKCVLINIFILSILLGLSAVAFFLLFRENHQPWMLSVAVTMLTFFYHFAMRLIVGETVTILYRNKNFPSDKLGFRLYPFEKGLYQRLNVKRWKKYIISAKPEQFNLNMVSPEDLLHNVMQAELVHRIIMILSFLPLILIIPFGAPWVFIITSVAACLIDSIFVIVQRFNRPKVQRYIELAKKVNKTPKQ